MIPKATIAPGVLLPLLSLGTGSGQHGNVTYAVQEWIALGGSAIDTAHDYNDQKAIALALKSTPRSDVFLTTKITCAPADNVKSQIADNLAQLGVSAVDLLLIHMDKCLPGGDLASTWSALEASYDAGAARSIGVSNFVQSDFEALQKTARHWPPALNQASLSVGYHDDATISYCDAHNITYMGYSPLCGGANGSSCRHGSVLGIPAVKSIAAAHKVSAAQVALKWIVQQGRPLATAVWRSDYMSEDLDLWSWGNLTQREMEVLRSV